MFVPLVDVCLLVAVEILIVFATHDVESIDVIAIVVFEFSFENSTVFDVHNSFAMGRFFGFKLDYEAFAVQAVVHNYKDKRSLKS